MLSWRLDQDREALQRILARSDERRAVIASAHAALKQNDNVANVAGLSTAQGSCLIFSCPREHLEP